MYSPGHHHHQPSMEYYFWMSQLLLFNWLQQGLLSAKTNSKKVMMYLINILYRPGKNRQNGKLLAGKFCELEGKNKEIHKGNPSTLEENLPCWREILPSLQGNIFFSQAWSWTKASLKDQLDITASTILPTDCTTTTSNCPSQTAPTFNGILLCPKWCQLLQQ